MQAALDGLDGDRSRAATMVRESMTNGARIIPATGAMSR
jgi:hypothetical protein